MSIYVTLLAGCVLTMILGKFVLAELRKLKAGQEIRQDGPTVCLAKPSLFFPLFWLYFIRRIYEYGDKVKVTFL